MNLIMGLMWIGCWGTALLLYLAQDWIVNWDPTAYKNLQGKPFPEPLRLKQHPAYPWVFRVTVILPGVLEGMRWLMARAGRG
jgi:hypothetical protein